MPATLLCRKYEREIERLQREAAAEKAERDRTIIRLTEYRDYIKQMNQKYERLKQKYEARKAEDSTPSEPRFIPQSEIEPGFRLRSASQPPPVASSNIADFLRRSVPTKGA